MLEDIYFNIITEVEYNQVDGLVTYKELRDRNNYKTIRFVFDIRNGKKGYWIEYNKNHIPLNGNGYVINACDNTENWRNKQIEKIIC